MPSKRTARFSSPLPLPKGVADYSLVVDECTLVDGVRSTTLYSPGRPPTEVVPCSNPLCHGGGYALSAVVRALSACGVDAEETVLCCEGYQLQEHTSGFRCPHFVKVRAAITYAPLVSSDGTPSSRAWEVGSANEGWDARPPTRIVPVLSGAERAQRSEGAIVYGVRQAIRDAITYGWMLRDTVPHAAGRTGSAGALKVRILFRAALERAARVAENLS